MGIVVTKFTTACVVCVCPMIKRTERKKTDANFKIFVEA